MYLATPKHLSVLARSDAWSIKLAQRTLTIFYRIYIHIPPWILVDVGAKIDHRLSWCAHHKGRDSLLIYFWKSIHVHFTALQSCCQLILVRLNMRCMTPRGILRGHQRCAIHDWDAICDEEQHDSIVNETYQSEDTCNKRKQGTACLAS